jgi:hypothetical protein
MQAARFRRVAVIYKRSASPLSFIAAIPLTLAACKAGSKPRHLSSPQSSNSYYREFHFINSPFGILILEILISEVLVREILFKKVSC